MRWSVVGLVLMGLVAAFCASVLVSTLRAGTELAELDLSQVAANLVAPAPEEVQVLVAAKDLPTEQMLDMDSVVTKTVRAEEAPPGRLSNPIQVIGKVLTRPLLEGQTVTESFISKDGSGLELALALPDGMRAIGISLSDHSALFGVLYPGCKVDVLVSFNPKAGQQPIADTLVQGIRVLGTNNRTIVSPDGGTGEGSGPMGRSRGQRQMVTLMVDPEQAEVIQSAMEHGTISLTLRNPRDDTRKESLATNQGDVPSKPSDRFWEIRILRDGKSETKKLRYLGSTLNQ